MSSSEALKEIARTPPDMRKLLELLFRCMRIEKKIDRCVEELGEEGGDGHDGVTDAR